MKDVPVIPFELGQKELDWIGLTDALAKGHLLSKAEIEDAFLYRDPDTLLNHAAWITGWGSPSNLQPSSPVTLTKENQQSTAV